MYLAPSNFSKWWIIKEKYGWANTNEKEKALQKIAKDIQ